MSNETLGNKPLFIDYRDHIAECEIFIENFLSPKAKKTHSLYISKDQNLDIFNDETIKNKIANNECLLKKLKAESKEDPNLAPHISFDTAIDSLKKTAVRLQCCLLNEKDQFEQSIQANNTYSSPKLKFGR